MASSDPDKRQNSGVVHFLGLFLILLTTVQSCASALQNDSKPNITIMDIVPSKKIAAPGDTISFTISLRNDGDSGTVFVGGAILKPDGAYCNAPWKEVDLRGSGGEGNITMVSKIPDNYLPGSYGFGSSIWETCYGGAESLICWLDGYCSGRKATLNKKNLFDIRRTCEAAVSTNLNQSTFSLHGPIVLKGGGLLWAVDEIPPGTYTITYEKVEGHIAPAPETKECAAGSTMRFQGEYGFLVNGSVPGNTPPPPYRPLHFTPEPIFQEAFQLRNRVVTAGQKLGFRLVVNNTVPRPIFLSNPEAVINIRRLGDSVENSLYENRFALESRQIPPFESTVFIIDQFRFDNSSLYSTVPAQEGDWIVTSTFRSLVRSSAPDGEILGTFGPPPDEDILRNLIPKEYSRLKDEAVNKSTESRGGFSWSLRVIGGAASLVSAAIFAFAARETGPRAKVLRTASILSLAGALVLLIPEFL